MKRVMLIIMVVTSLMLTGCTSKEKSDVKNVSNIELNNNDIILSVKDDSLTSNGATFIVKNNSDQLFGYSEYYHLEKKQNDSWYILNLITKAAFTAPLWGVKSGDEVEIKVDWDVIYGSLEPGEYRFIKDGSFINEDGRTENFYVGAEFVIE